MHATRRELLKLAVMAAGASLVPRSGWSADPLARAARPKKITIIGAGLAGLVAAHELVKAGHDVTILEAQLRPGGRVFTVREPFSDGLYAEAGAARIPDNHEITLRYVRELGLPLVPFYPAQGSRVLSVRGTRYRMKSDGDLDLTQVPFDLSDEERRVGLFGLFERYFGEAMRTLGDPMAPDWPQGKVREYDNVTLPEFLKQRGASPGAIDLLEWPWATAQDDRTSCLWNLREFVYESTEKARYKIQGGNDRLPKAFAAGLKERIRYGCPVVRIEQDQRGVRAITREAGALHTLESERLIRTVPFPALQTVDVRPAFSAAKRRAIDELTYDTITRVTLQCRTRFWEKDGFSGYGVSDLPQEIWAPAFDQPGPRGLLVSFLCSGIGERAGAMEPEERLQFVARALDSVHPGTLANFEGGFAQVWHKDPWTRGALALPSPGQMTSICIGIEKPEGRVHFAGEHTSRQTGWMQGALQSGLRAAKEVSEAA